MSVWGVHASGFCPRVHRVHIFQAQPDAVWLSQRPTFNTCREVFGRNMALWRMQSWLRCAKIAKNAWKREKDKRLRPRKVTLRPFLSVWRKFFANFCICFCKFFANFSEPFKLPCSPEPCVTAQPAPPITLRLKSGSDVMRAIASSSLSTTAHFTSCSQGTRLA